MGSSLAEVSELMKDSKFRVFASNIDKALKSFEYSSEWPDLISALGKLNKVLSSNTKYSMIPRRHKIAKRLAQCLHPHLPSGVHLKALEIYDIIFKCMGTRRLSQELFIYSAGLFPVLGFAAMNVRPDLLSMYEVHFVPLGERLGPALCGFLSGVLPGLEEGSDHYDRTFSLLEKVCAGVGPRLYYGKLWECISTNSAIRLAAISYVLAHFDKRLSMEDQLHIMGTNVDVMVNGLCACVQDSSVLVQRSALDLLLVGFPMHNSQLVRSDMLRLVGAALVTVLRRDMSLNRRLFTWLLGSEVTSVDQTRHRSPSESAQSSHYFEVYSRALLITAIKTILHAATGACPQHDLKPYRLLISLLDKPEIGPVILDDILFEVFRLLYLCSQSPGPAASNASELMKTGNLLFSSLEPCYFWQYTGTLFSEACKRVSEGGEGEREEEAKVKEVGSASLSLMEVCVLIEFILDTVTVESYSDTPSEHLPSLFLTLVSALRDYCAALNSAQTAMALGLLTKILSRVQPTIVTAEPEPSDLAIDTFAKDASSVAKETSSVAKDAGSVAKETSSVAKDASLVAKETSSVAKDASSVPKGESRSRLDTGNESMRSGEMNSLRSDLSGSVFNSETSIDSVISTGPASLASLCSTATLRNASSVGNLHDFDTGEPPSEAASGGSGAPGGEPITAGPQQLPPPSSSPLPPPTSPVPPPATPAAPSSSPAPPSPSSSSLCMETCLAQYERFYVVFVEVVRGRIGETAPVAALLDSLRIKSYQSTSEERAKVLEDLLRKVLFKPDDLEISQYRPDTQHSGSAMQVTLAQRNMGTEWTQAMQVASKLLVELSTFLTSTSGVTSGASMSEAELAVVSCDDVLPGWLQMLVVCACWLGNTAPSLQLAAISTLLDLVTLCRAQAAPAAPPSSGFTALILVPLLRPHHATFLETQTNAFQVIAHWLWDHLGNPTFQVRCVELLHQLQSALYSSDVAENCIGEALLQRNASETKRLMSFRRFAILWHVGREVTARMGTLHIGDIFYKSMLKMLDNLQLSENCPLKVEAQVWLLHSIMRGDIHRLLDPLLMMLLDPATARLSVLHARISTHQECADAVSERDEEEAEGTTRIYAISSVDGNVMYHVSDQYAARLKDSSAPLNRPPSKKIIAVTSLSGDTQYITTEKKRVDQNINQDPGLDTYTTYSKNLSLLQNISVFVNPFSTDTTTSMLNNDFDDYFVEEKREGETASAELIGKAVRITSTDAASSGRTADDGKAGSGKRSAFKLSKPNVNIIRNNSFSSLESVKNSLIVNPSSVMISSVEFAKNLSNISDTLFSKISDGKRDHHHHHNKENNASISNEILPYSSGGGRDSPPQDNTGDLVRSCSFSGKESSHTVSTDLEVSTPADEYFKPLASKSSSQTVLERVLDEMCEYVDKHGGGGAEETGGEDKEKEATPPPCMKDSLDSADNVSLQSQGHQSEGSPLPSHKELENSLPSNKNLDSPLPSNKMESPLPSNKMESPLPSIKMDSPLPSNKNLDSPLPTIKNLESPLPGNKNLDSALPSNKNVSMRASSSVGNSVESTHAHVLFYCGVYDSARTQYALQTIRNMILPNSRAFLCAAATTALAPRSPILKLLARHRKCLFGRGFHGDIESSGLTYSRSSMYLEVLISVCLYYIRSYYLNLGQARLTMEEIAGNRQVQIASVELLSVILSELAGIVRDSGKGLSCYLADLLARTKVQKVILHCVLASVTHAKTERQGPPQNFVEEILAFNSAEDEDAQNNNSGGAAVSSQCLTLQIQLLKLLLSALILEHEINTKRGEPEASPPPLSSLDLTAEPKYYPNRIIPQQPMFLCALARALESNPGLRTSHQHWTTMLTCALPYLGKSLTTVVKVVIKSLCANIDYIAEVYSEDTIKTNIPADYAITQMEALTILCHYCLLDSAQPFNQPLLGVASSSAVPSQIFNNLVHVFIPSPVTEHSKEIVEPLKNVRSVVLNCLRRILSSLVLLWEALMSREQRDNENSVAGSPRVVKSQLLELLSPVALHHGPNFLAAFASVWKDRKSHNNNNSSSSNGGKRCSNGSSQVSSSQSNQPAVLPVANERQKSLVQLLNAIKAMPIDTLVQTIHQVIRSTTINMEPSMGMEVSVLELLLHYISLTPPSPLLESWASLLLLLREGATLSPPSQFILLAILSQFVHKTASPLPDKRDQKDLQDITAKLIESCAGIAGACLEQTTWLRRNLAVKEDELTSATSDKDSDKFGTTVAQYSVQALSVLAQLLAPLLDVTYGSQEKERVNTLLTTLMYNVTPYLKNHSQRNAVSFHACSTLLASLSSYQYTRKAWKKDAMDLLLDPALFQMELKCLRAWQTIVDNLMSQEPATFRDLMTRVSLSQSNSLSLFSNKEQEYEQRAQLLKKLAFVILCSETDQFHKHIPEITEKLSESLKLPTSVPGVQAQVFLCFRVLLLRMSPSNVTSMWPNIVSEMVQVFLLMEQDLAPADTDDNSSGRATPPESLSSPTSPVPSYRGAAGGTPKHSSGGRSVLKKKWRRSRTPNQYTVEPVAATAPVTPAITGETPAAIPPPPPPLIEPPAKDSSARLSGLDWSWVMTWSNGTQASLHPHWLQLQLAAVKLLDFALNLPAERLPQFQMYRWAFVGSADVSPEGSDLGAHTTEDFVPHVTRIANLMDLKFGPCSSSSPSLPSTASIKSLQDLHPFFAHLGSGLQDLTQVRPIQELERDIEVDFLEPLPLR